MDNTQTTLRVTRNSGRLPSRLPTANTNQPRTFEERVQWAVKHREVYRFPNAEEYKHIKIGVIEEGDDEEYIRQLQKSYERKCDIQRATVTKESIEKKKMDSRELEMLTAKTEFLSKFPGATISFGDGNKADLGSNVRTACKRAYDAASGENVELAELPRNKIQKTGLRKEKERDHGKAMETPCERCYKKNIVCHEQKPKKTSCFECREAKDGCSFNKRHNNNKSSKRRLDDAEYETDTDSETEKAGPLTVGLPSTGRLNDESTTAVEILESILSEIRAQRIIWEQASKTLEIMSANIRAMAADRSRVKSGSTH